MQVEDSHVSNKRPFEDQIEPDVLKKPKLTDSNIPEDLNYKLVEVICSTYKEDEEKNVVWMHPQDVIELFGPESFLPRFIKIADFVYEVATKEIMAGSICINENQNKEIETKLSYCKNGSRYVVVSAMSLSDQKIQRLTSIQLEINFRHLLTNQQAYDFTHLLMRCTQALNNKIIYKNQVFTIDSKCNHIKATVKALESAKSIFNLYSVTYGFIDEHTQIAFTNAQSDQISIVKEIRSENLSTCKFNVSFWNSAFNEDNSFLRGFTETKTIDYDLFLKAIFMQLKDKILFKNLKSFFTYGDCDFQLLLKDLKGKLMNLELPFGHKGGMLLDAKTKIDFTAYDHDIIFTKGYPLLAKEASFEVVDILETSIDKNLTQAKKPWVDMEELANIIRKQKSLSIGQRLKVTLSTGIFLVKLLSVDKTVHVRKQIADKETSFKTLWRFTENSDLTFGIHPSLNTLLIADSITSDIEEISFEVSCAPVISLNETKNEAKPKRIDVLEKHLLEAVQKELEAPFVKGKKLKVKIFKKTYTLTVKNIAFQEDSQNEQGQNERIEGEDYLGVLKKESVIQFTPKNKDLISVVPQKSKLNVNKLNTTLNELGLGGLKKQVDQLARRVVIFQDESFQDVIESNNLKPVKGVIFAGPPGTGKTTLAKHLSKLLGVSEDRTTYVKGPEIFKSLLGQSEESIRKLFEEAEIAQKKWGKDSPLFCIVFDEFDSIGSERNENLNKVRESVVNQILTCMDGFTELTNILVVAITNRLDLIDKAFLRPGRFEFNLEIGLPDVEGRLEILEIYTKTLKSKNRLAKDVNLKKIAKKLTNFSGADIKGLIQAATSYSLERILLNPNAKGIEREALLVVTKEDITKAIEECTKKTNSGNGCYTGMYT